MAVLPKKGEVRIWLALFLFLFAFNISKIEAATCTWAGGTDLNASTAANWSACGGTVPQSTDDVSINATSDQISWDASAPATINSLTLGTSFTGTTTLARSLTVTTDIAVNGGAFSTGAQNLTIQGGDFTVASGKTATSTTGGTVTIQGTGTLGGAGIMTLANLTIGNSTTIGADVTLGGNVSVSGNCGVLSGAGGFPSPSVTASLSSYQLSCLGTFTVSTNGNLGGNVSFNAGSGTLSVLATTTVKNDSGFTASTVTFNGDTASLSFGGELVVDNIGALAIGGGSFTTIFNAGTSGNMTVTGSTTITSGYNDFVGSDISIFNGGAKNMTFNGPVRVTTPATGVGTTYFGTYFNAGTSGTATFNSSVIVDASGTSNLASTTWNGQAKNLIFNGGLTLQTVGATTADVLYTPSTGTNTINGNFNFLDSAGSTSASSLVWADPSSVYNMSITGNVTLTNGAGSALFDFSPGVGTTTFSGSGAQAITAPSGTVFNNVAISNTGSSTVTFSNSATTTNLFITQGTLVSGANTIGVTGVYKNTAGAAGTTWTGGTLYLSGTSQTITGADTYATLQIGADTDIRINGSSASVYTVSASGSLYSTDHAGVDGELYIWGDYHVPTSGSVASPSTYSIDYWSYATDFDGSSLSGGSERQVKVYIAPGATVNVENVAGVGPKRLKIIGTATYPTLISRQGGSGYYTFKVNKGRLHANYFQFDYLDSSGLQITNAAVAAQMDNGVFDNGQSGGSFINISLATTTLVANNITFNNTGSTASYNVSASGRGVNWRFVNSAGAFDGESYDNPSSSASLIWSDSSISTTTPSVLSTTSIQWNFTESAGSEKAFALFDTDNKYKMGPSLVYNFATGTITLGYVGDSLTSGVTGFTNASPSSDYLTDNGTDGFPSQIDALLDSVTGTSTKYYNGGIGGWTTGDWVYDISGGSFAPLTFSAFYTNAPAPGALNENPDIVLILLGTNDVSSLSAATYKTYISDIVDNVIERGGTPFISYLPPYYSDGSSGAELYASNMADYNAKILELANETGAFLGPDLYGAMKNYTTLLGQDAMYAGAVHFQELGFSAIANEWLNTLMLTGGNMTAAANLTSITETGLTPNTSYQRVIHPMNAAGLGLGATTSAVYTLAAAPSGASASRSGLSATLTWSASGNPAGTEYYVSNVTDGQNSGWITDTSYTFSSPSAGALSFTVKARNGNGVETEATSASATAAALGGVPVFFGTNIPLSIPGQISPANQNTEKLSQKPEENKKTSSSQTSQNNQTAKTLSGPFVFGERSQKTKTLQEYLSKDKTIYPEGKITGYYGPLTKKAVGRFQERYGLATKSDDFYGLAGPKTRAKMNEVWQKMSNVSTNSWSEAVIESLRAQIKALQEKINLLLSQKTLS